MKLKLRNARRLDQDLSGLIGDLTAKLTPQVTVTIFDSITPAWLSGKTSAIYADYETIVSLVALRTKLRNAIGEANQTSGINARLTELASRESVLAALNQFLNQVQEDAYGRRKLKTVTPYSTENLNLDRLSEQLNVMHRAANSGNVAAAPTTLTVNILNDEMSKRVKSLIAKTKAAISTLKDEVAALNLQQAIDLPVDETTRRLLEDHGIIS